MPKFLLAAGAVALLMTMTGCHGPAPHVTLGPTPSATPVFASDEEALAAAEDAYRAYQTGLDHALTTYDTAGLRELASDSALSEALQSVDGFRSKGQVLAGNSSIDSASLIQFEATGRVEIYACLDISATDVLDQSGRSTVPTGRPTRFPMHITLTWFQPISGLRVNEAEVWDGDNFCG